MNYSRIMPPNNHYLFNSLPLEPVSRTYQYRKIMKPMLERKRRARINKCLDELKDLMTGTLQADGENVSKLEKADILELTVRHLHRLREHNALFLHAGSETMNMEKFWAGFQHCAVEVSQFLSKYDPTMSGDLVKYIASYIPNMAAAATAATTTTAAAAASPTTATKTANYQRFSAAIQQMLPTLSAAATSTTNIDQPLVSPAPHRPKPSGHPRHLYEAAGAAANRMRLHPYAKLVECDGGDDGDGYSDGGVWRPW